MPTIIKKTKDKACCSSGKCTGEQPNTQAVTTTLGRINASWCIGTVSTPVGEVPRVSTEWNLGDRLGSWKVRWGISRYTYSIQPGLYAVGNPNAASNVFVSANYKLSFDHLRRSLHGIDGWILVIDTKGINVWCAAGKGTFGTDEIVNRVHATGLSQVVTHRKLIVPQLGAPGVSAHLVRQHAGFKVMYGPVRAADLAKYIENGLKTTPEMRNVTFNFGERIVLGPEELVGGLKQALMLALPVLLLSGLGPSGYHLENIVSHGIGAFVTMFVLLAAGSLIGPALLPILPGRPFALKGAILGLLFFILFQLGISHFHGGFDNVWHQLSVAALFISISSYIVMNFTGSSTLTSLSGVLKEMRIALPFQISLAIVSLIFWVGGMFAKGGV